MLMLDSDVNDRQVLLQNKQESPIERESDRNTERALLASTHSTETNRIASI